MISSSTASESGPERVAGIGAAAWGQRGVAALADRAAAALFLRAGGILALKAALADLA